MNSSAETNLLENQSSSAFPKKNPQKPYILTSIFILILIISAIITVTTVVIIRRSGPSSVFTIVGNPAPSKNIKVVCSFAPYRQICITSLSTFNSTNTSKIFWEGIGNNHLDTYPFPECIIFRSFQLSVNQLINLANISNPDDIPELRECGTLLNKEVSGLNDSVASSKNLYSFTGHEVSEYLEVFNRINTYQEACLDTLEQSGLIVIDEIKRNVQITRTYMRNTRAILYNSRTILDKIYGSPSSGFDFYSEYFDWLSYEFIVFYVPQYVILIVLLILMLKLY